MALCVVDVCKFHSQVVCPLQFRIVLEDDICPPPLRFRPLGLVLGQYEFGACQQLLAGVSIGIAERLVLLASLPGLLDFLAL
jgi:hypothetical protein